MSVVFNYMEVIISIMSVVFNLTGGDHQQYECGVQLPGRRSSALCVWCSITRKVIISIMSVVFNNLEVDHQQYERGVRLPRS